MFREGAEVWVNLYDPAAKRGEWSVVPGTIGSSLRLESYDPLLEQLMVVQAGQRLNLPLGRSYVTLPANLRPLVFSAMVRPPLPAENSRDSFITQLPPEAREILTQAQRRRRERVPTTLTSTPSGQP